jgi:hypothetical protein
MVRVCLHIFGGVGVGAVYTSGRVLAPRGLKDYLIHKRNPCFKTEALTPHTFLSNQ